MVMLLGLIIHHPRMPHINNMALRHLCKTLTITLHILLVLQIIVFSSLCRQITCLYISSNKIHILPLPARIMERKDRLRIPNGILASRLPHTVLRVINSGMASSTTDLLSENLSLLDCNLSHNKLHILLDSATNRTAFSSLHRARIISLSSKICFQTTELKVPPIRSQQVILR